MRAPANLEPWWPTPRQSLLLRAALLPEEPAAAAWQEWRDTGALDDVDSGSFRLLPLLYRNLARHQIDEPQLPRLRGVYRQAWYRNQLAMERAQEAVRVLAGEGIPVMILKGAALIDGVYGELGARPMNDVDLMVPRGSAKKALRLLTEAGWSCPTHPDGDFQRPMRIVHGLPLLGPNGLAIDLHWRLLDESPAGQDAAFWDAAEAFQFDGQQVTRLCPADQLLHLSVHGIRWDPIPPIRWAADLYLLIERRGPDIDWERLVAQATDRGLTLELLAALAYVKQSLGAEVPGEVLRRLRAAQPSRLAYLDFRAQGAHTTVSYQVARYVTRYARLSQGQPMLRRLADAAFYLQELWGLQRARDVPLDGARRTAARIRDVGFRIWKPLPAPNAAPPPQT
ncbi:MAG: nucleotidyltransferase domain-containing protein [Tepidiformaceae bacterium]